MPGKISNYCQLSNIENTEAHNKFLENIFDPFVTAKSSRGKSHGPHKFHIPVVPRRHSFDDRILATAVSKPSGGESSFTRESIGREAELEMKLAIVSNALMKEGEEKQRLESDLKRAVKENRKLQENLHMASKQLRKFSEWFFSNRDKSNS